MASDFPFFLLGHDRSGTTMLRLILDRGDVAVPPESMFLLDVDPAAARGGRAARRVEPSARAAVGPHRRAARRCRQGLNGTDAFRFAVSAPFVAYAEREGKAALG